MGTDPLLDKMDALLKRHRVLDTSSMPAQPAQQTTSESPSLPEDAWLPVLTDVVAIGAVDAQASAEPPPLPEDAWLPVLTDMVAMGSVEAQAEESLGVVAIDMDVLMQTLEPQLNELMLVVAGEIQRGLEASMAAAMEQLKQQLKETVRQALKAQQGL